MPKNAYLLLVLLVTWLLVDSRLQAEDIVLPTQTVTGSVTVGTSTTDSITANSYTIQPPGSAVFQAKALIDLKVGFTASAGCTFDAKLFPPPNQPPTIALIGPASGTVLVAPATIALRVTAADSDGTVARVDYYNGAALIATVTASPFSFNWTGAGSGTYVLTAKATDNLGAATTSAAVTMYVDIPVNVAPTVVITNPVGGASITATSSLPIQVSAADADGTVTKVDYFLDGSTYIGTATVSPFTLTWTVSASVGAHTLTAKATDNSGAATTSSPVAITVVGAPPGSYITLVSPQNGAITGGTYYGHPLGGFVCQADYSNFAGRSINRIEYSTIAGAVFSVCDTAPYTYTYNPGFGINFGINATLYLSDGSRYPTQAPTYVSYLTSAVQMDSPADGQTIPLPGSIKLRVYVVEISPATTVQFIVRLGAAAPFVETATPEIDSHGTKSWVCQCNGLAAGNYTVYTEVQFPGNTWINSTTVNFTVAQPNTPPVIALTSPVSGAVLAAPATIPLRVTATDPDGTVAQVEYYNGATRIAKVTTSPFSFDWTGVGAGTYVLTAKATDNLGATTTTPAVTMYVDALPTVALTAPTPGFVFGAPSSIVITANATDIDGTVRQVDFYNGSTLLGSVPASPYRYVWTGAAIGTYSLTARATDDRGLTTTSAPVSISVAANQLPTVSMTASGGPFTAPATISLQATAADSDGTVQSVDFYNGSTLLGRSTASPYGYTWTQVPSGSYSLTAKATDNSGGVATSAVVSVTVNNAPPTVAITSPLNGNIVAANGPLTISATATDDVSVSQVDFYQGSTWLGTATTSPYSYTWPSVPQGTYSLTAKAIDNQGASTVSAAVSVTATATVLPSVAFQVATSQVSESVGTTNLSVVLSSAWASAVTVNYAVTGGTAQGTGPNADYSLASGTLTFAAGQTTQVIPLTIINDTLPEDDETVIVSLSAPSSAALGANASHTCTIQDDDVGAPTITPAGGSFIGSGTVTIVPHPASAQVWYTTGTAPADPVPAAPSLLYSAPLAVSTVTTIKAISVIGTGSNQHVSALSSASFVGIDPTTVHYASSPPAGGSKTSPLCVEITTPTTGVSIAMDGNGVATPDLHVIGPNLAFGNVPLSPTGLTTITTRIHADNANTGNSSDTSQTQTATWAPTDLNVTNPSVPAAKVTIRHGDSLLFTASTATGPWTLDPGTGCGPQPVSLGAKVPTPYMNAGTYTAVAAGLTGQLGIMQVTVVDAPFPSAEILAAEVNYARPYTVAIIPGGDDQDIVMSAADSSLLDVAEAAGPGGYAFSQSMTLKPKQRGFPVVLARLGSGGPIISWKEVTEFTIEQPDSMGLVSYHPISSNTAYFANPMGVFFMHPYIPGLTFTFSGQLATLNYLAPSDKVVVSDSMKPGFDPVLGERIASHVFTLGTNAPQSPLSWNLTATQVVADPLHQGSTRTDQVSRGESDVPPTQAPINVMSLSFAQPTALPGPNTGGGGVSPIQYAFRLPGATLVTDPATTGITPLNGFGRAPDYQVATQMLVTITPDNPKLWSWLNLADTFRGAGEGEGYTGVFTIAPLPTLQLATVATHSPATIPRTLIYYGGAVLSGVRHSGDSYGELFHRLLLGVDLDRDGASDTAQEVNALLNVTSGFYVPTEPARTTYSTGFALNGKVSKTTYTWNTSTQAYDQSITDEIPPEQVILAGNMSIQIIADPLPADAPELVTVSISRIDQAFSPDLPGSAMTVTTRPGVTTSFRLSVPGHYSIMHKNFLLVGAGAYPGSLAGSSALGTNELAMLPTLPTYDAPVDATGPGGTTETHELAWMPVSASSAANLSQILQAPVLFGMPSLNLNVTRDTPNVNLVLPPSTTGVFVGSQLSASMAPQLTGGSGANAFQGSFQQASIGQSSYGIQCQIDSLRDCDATFGFQVNGTLSQSAQIVRLSDQLGPPAGFDPTAIAFPGYSTINANNGNLYLRIPIQSYAGPEAGPDIVAQYNSRDIIDCGYGPGWRTNYDLRVYRAGRQFALVDIDSQRIRFDDSGHAAADPGRHPAMEVAWKDRQTHEGTLSTDWQSGETYRVIRHDNRVYYCNAAGWLVRIRQLDGREFHVTRDSAGVAQSVQDDFGRKEDLAPALLGVTGGRLHALNHGQSGIWSFVYDTATNTYLTEITLANAPIAPSPAVSVLHVQVAYDAKARATTVSNLTQSGLDTSITYNDSGASTKATWTTPLGGVSTLYTNGSVKDGVGILHMRSAASSFIARATDGNGNFDATSKQGQQDATYDALGNQVSSAVYDRTGHQQVTTWTYTDLTDQNSAIVGANLLRESRVKDVAGIDGVALADIVTSYRYQTATGKACGQVLSVTDPSGNATSNTYDANGFLTATVDARGKSWTYGNPTKPGQPQLVTAPGLPVRTVTRAYNPDGTLKSETDVQAGYVTTYGYDAMGRQTCVTPPGTTAKVVTLYDALGRVLSTRDVNGYVVSHTYDSLGRQLSESRPGAADVKIAYTTTTGGWLATQTRGSSPSPVSVVHSDFAGRTTSVDVYRTLVAGSTAASICTSTNTYDPTYGWLTKSTAANEVTDGSGLSTVYVPDLIGRATKVTTPENEVSTTVYNGLGWVLTVTDPVGAVTTTTYTLSGQPCKTVNAMGGVVETRYDATGNVAAVVPNLGNPVTVQYDDAGTAIGQIDALGIATARVVNPSAKTITTKVVGDDTTAMTTTLDARGFPQQIDNPTLGTTTMTLFDDGALNKVQPSGRGQVVRTRDATLFQANSEAVPATLAGNNHQPLTQALTFDPTFGSPDVVTDPFMHKVHPVRDAVTGEVNQVVDNTSNPTAAPADKLQEVQSRDANGNVLRLKVGDVSTVVQTFDHDNRILTRTAKGATTTWTYTHRGQVATMTTGGVTTTYQYDLLGHCISTMVPGRSPRTVDYDSFGVPQQSSDGLAFTNQIYDPATRQLLSTVESSGKVTTYQYDGRGRTVDVSDNRGGGVHKAYDAFDRPTTLTYRDGKTEQFTYEPTGEVKTHTDRGLRTVTYTRDESGHLLQSTTSTGTTVTYDLSLPATGGKVESRTLGGQAIRRTTDVRGRLSTLAMPGAADVTFTYNGDDTPSTRAGISYGYDPLTGQLASISEGGVGTAQFGYDGNGKLLTAALPNGVIRTYLYDSSGALGRLKQQPGDATLEDWIMTRDGQGRLTQVTGPDGATTFMYDEAGRLVQEQRAAVSPAIVQYGYDGSDNRSAVVTYLTPAPALEAFSGASLPATVASAAGTWTVSGGALHGAAVNTTTPGTATLTLTPSATLRCPTVSVQVKPTAPAAGGAVNAAGLQVTSTTSPVHQYQALWRVGPPVAGDFNGLPQGSLAVVQDGTTLLAVSSPIGDDGTARTLTLTIWPDDRITVQADGTNLGGTLRVDVPTPGVNSGAASLPALGLMTTGSSTFGQLSWSVAASRTVRTSSFDLFNRLTADSEISTDGGVATVNTAYGYDNFDRLATRTRTPVGSAAVATTYGYDDLDRMTTVAVGGATQATMTYYGDSWMRATEVAGGVRTAWTYDGAQMLSQTTTQGTASQTVNFVHHAGQALWEHDAAFTAPGLRVYAYDPFGNVRGHIATMTAGAVTQNVYQRQFAYDAFGNVLREQIAAFSGTAFGLAPISGAPSSGLRAKGMFLDGGLNLYKTQTRSYAADLGRFTQQDPAKAGQNWYAYCGGDPINRSDTNGLDWSWNGNDWDEVAPFGSCPKPASGFGPEQYGMQDAVGSLVTADTPRSYMNAQSWAGGQVDVRTVHGGAAFGIIAEGYGQEIPRSVAQLGEDGVQAYMGGMAYQNALMFEVQNAQWQDWNENRLEDAHRADIEARNKGQAAGLIALGGMFAPVAGEAMPWLVGLGEGAASAGTVAARALAATTARYWASGMAWGSGAIATARALPADASSRAMAAAQQGAAWLTARGDEVQEFFLGMMGSPTGRFAVAGGAPAAGRKTAVNMAEQLAQNMAGNSLGRAAAGAFGLKTLFGKTANQVQKLIPKGWRKSPVDSGSGWKYVDENGIERIRFMRPDAQGRWAHAQTGYWRWQNEKGEFLDELGNVVSAADPNFNYRTHIVYSGVE